MLSRYSFFDLYHVFANQGYIDLTAVESVLIRPLIAVQEVVEVVEVSLSLISINSSFTYEHLIGGYGGGGYGGGQGGYGGGGGGEY